MVSRGGVVSIIGGAGTRSPIWGIYANRALWSLKSVGIAIVMVGGGCFASGGMRISQWSSDVFLGV